MWHFIEKTPWRCSCRASTVYLIPSVFFGIGYAAGLERNKVLDQELLEYLWPMRIMWCIRRKDQVVGGGRR